MLVMGLRLLRTAGLRPNGDLLLVSAPSKKHRRGIAAALHHGLSADAAVHLHPAESGRGLDEIKAYAPGQLEFMITVRGREPDTLEPAQTAFAHLAVCAFDKMMVIAEALREFNLRRGRQIVRSTIDKAIGRSTNLILSRCTFGSDAALSRMAMSCRLSGAMNLVPGERLDDVMATVATPRVNPRPKSSVIQNPVVQKGMPTVDFGPLCGGLIMAGKADEWVDVADHHRAVCATGLLIADWCGVSPL